MYWLLSVNIYFVHMEIMKTINPQFFLNLSMLNRQPTQNNHYEINISFLYDVLKLSNTINSINIIYNLLILLYDIVLSGNQLN